MTLNTQPNLTRPDDFYEALIDMHRDFDDAQSQSANAQLILLLANHIGDHATLLEALQRVQWRIPRVAPGMRRSSSLTQTYHIVDERLPDCPRVRAAVSPGNEA